MTTGRGRWLGGITSRTETGTCNAMRRGLRTFWTTCRMEYAVVPRDDRGDLERPLVLQKGCPV